MAAIKEVGSFYAGGRVVTRSGQPVEMRDLGATLKGFEYDPNGTYVVESCYVQYFLPQEATGIPVVLIHGGALTGAMWENTPTGRRGWVQQLLELGRPVYVIDGVERGRAGFVPFGDIWPDKPMWRASEEAWWLYRIGDPSGFPSRTPYEGQRFPIDGFDGLMRQTVPRWTGTVGAAFEAYRAALRRIGPAVVFAHSSGGVFGLRLAQEEPELVRAVIGCEPSTFPGGGAYPGNTLFITVMGDYLDRLQFWRSLMPQLHGGIGTAADGGAVTEYHELADLGLPNHSHMYMMDDGNELVLEAILELLDKRLRHHGLT